ncbi:MAG: hypothetical protein KUG73_09625 [Pseudomonadales bacterium]|nr:hypothetical protein [Pseudomonadales bacterium]
MLYYIMQGIGLFGAAALLIAYLQISRKALSTTSKHYHLLNLLGSGLLVINTAYFEVYGPLFLNAIWMLIAIKSLVSKH